MGLLLVCSLVSWCFLAEVQINAFYYRDRDGQPHFDPAAHGLPDDDSSSELSWSEIFADEYQELMERENRAKPSYVDEDDDVFKGHFEVVPDWPNQKLPLGQIGGMATDDKGLLHIFHRANRVWNQKSFSKLNIYKDHNRTTIKEPTIMTLNSSDGRIVGQWGTDLFVLPHGLEIDNKGNVYMTDVALHQVFKFESGKHTPSLILGEAFRPAKSDDDDTKFCMPTDIAVASSGIFFVSDGYCASRIMMFDQKGKFLLKFGVGDSMIPHGVALAEDLDLLCVADREGMRILCYQAGLNDSITAGLEVQQFTNDNFGRMYGITYSITDGLLYGIIGKTGGLKTQGFSMDLRDNEAYDSDVIAYWSPDVEGFTSPHAICLSRDDGVIFVGEAGPNYVWKFEKDF